MLIKAKKSFSGAISMHKGQVMECSDKAVLQDLLSAGYVEEATAEGGKNESKRSTKK